MGNTKPDEHGWLGNPFYSAKTTEAAIYQYEVAFLAKIRSSREFRVAVARLWDKRIGCFCKPGPCHLDVVVAFVTKYACCECCNRTIKRTSAQQCEKCRFLFCDNCCSGIECEGCIHERTST